MICPKKKEIEQEFNMGVRAFLFGLEGFATNCDTSLTIKEVHEMKTKYLEMELFLLMNKNIFNHELKNVEEILISLEQEKLSGIFFYDQAILSIHQRLGLKTPLVWNQTHMVTNYNTCNYYYEEGASFALVAGEITLDEIVEIKKNTKMKLMVTVLGYPVMSHSNRKLLSNYFEFVQEEKRKKVYTLNDAGKEGTSLVEEDKTGTTFYDGLLLNGTSVLFSLLEHDISYAVIYEKEISDEKLEKIIPLYLEILSKTNFSEEEKASYVEKSNEILQSNHTGFFFKKTIYKVKKNG